MWRSSLFLLLTLCAILPFGPASAQDTVLIVVSGEGRDGGKTRPGYEFDELAQAWLIFQANGLNVEVASPDGGSVEASNYNRDEPFNATLLADSTAMKKLQTTRRISDLRAEDYAAIYIVGGKGAMFDLPRSTALQQLLTRAWNNGSVLAAVCHGPAALINVRLADGSALISNRRVTGISNEEEAIFAKKWSAQFPWLLEDAARNGGATWSEAPLLMPHVVVDGKLITGQNPYSTTAVAEAVVRGLGKRPAARELWPDERTMKLIQRLRQGGIAEATREVARDPTRFNIQLIGLLGYYQAQAAGDDSALLTPALQTMQLALPYMNESRLKLAIAQAHLTLQQPAKARELTLQLLESEPQMEQAKALLKRIDG